MEERINAIANSLVESIAYKPNEYDLGIAKDALTMIATEQKAIDIERAWEWIEGWVFENASHEIFDELMSARQDFNNTI